MDKATMRSRIRAGRERPIDGLDHAGYCRTLAAFLDGAVPVGAWIVIYDALPDEVRLDDLTAAHPRPTERYALTRTPDRGHALTVHPLGGPTERHPYGYRQPRLDGPLVADADIGAVLVPGLSFDRLGYRLGRGGGYYDRFLARLEPAVLRVGITDGDVVDALPIEDHDMAMTHLARPGRVLTVPLGPSVRPA